MHLSLVTNALAIALTGCASFPQAIGCAPGEQAAVSELFYFGTDKPRGGVVSPEEWTAFLNEVVTPRFPAGLTVWQASGQWRSANGDIVKEGSYVLNLLHPPEAAAEKAVQAVVAEYKTRFRQEAVLRVKGRACMSL